MAWFGHQRGCLTWIAHGSPASRRPAHAAAAALCWGAPRWSRTLAREEPSSYSWTGSSMSRSYPRKTSG